MFYVNYLEIHTHTHTHTHSSFKSFQNTLIIFETWYTLHHIYMLQKIHVFEIYPTFEKNNKKMVFSVFFKWFTNNLLLKVNEHQKNCIVKVMLLNEIVKHPLFKSKLEIETFNDSIWISQHPY